MKLRSYLDDFLFRPSSPLPLALCRVLFFGWLFCWYLDFDFTAISFYPPELWRPMQLLKLVRLDFIPPAETLAIVQTIWKASLLLACVGFLTRPSALVASLLGAYLLALTHSFYKINHSDGLLVIAMGVLALSRSHDALSVDRLFRKTRGTHATSLPPPSGDYTWPIQAVRLAVVLLFLGSGISKLLVGGWQWMFSDNLYNIVSYCQLTRDTFLHLDIQSPLFYRVLAIGTVVIELAAPLALFHGPSRLFIVPALLGMQIGIRLVMGDNFTQFVAIYLFWVPWMTLGIFGRSVQARSTGPASAPLSKTMPRRLRSAKQP